jgi:signal peptidase II
MDRRLTMSASLPFLLATCVFLLDRVTKMAIESRVSMWETIVLIPGVLNIVYTRNRGAAFGILSDAPDGLREFLLIGVSLAVMGLIIWMLIQAVRGATPSTGWTRIALGLVLGGAAGNLYDRIVSGSVTDFIQVFIGSYEWPSFNVADSAITVGAVLLGLDMLRSRGERKQHGAA